MSMQRLTTWGGDYHVNSTESEITDGNFYGFTVVEDGTTVSIMTGGPEGNMPSPASDFKAYCNLTGKLLPAGTRVTVPLDNIIKNFKLSAGAVMLHKSHE